MTEIAEFFEQQDRLARVYAGPILNHHHQNARDITARLGGSGKRILELGAGGGQNAAALAELGHDVTALELVPRATAHALTLARGVREGRLTVFTANFYDVALEGTFDAVCYFDGFGVGPDADQQRLLRRIAGWLGGSGVALIDVFTPWYWASVAGIRHQQPGWVREYSFDGEGCRMLDTWWSSEQPDYRVTQSLRCYSPADLRLLTEGTGLRLSEVVSQGMFDQAARIFKPKVPLEQAMTYLAVLEPTEADI